MSLQGLKLKKTLPPLHTESDLLAKGGHLLMKATDPRHSRVLVKDEKAVANFCLLVTWL